MIRRKSKLLVRMMYGRSVAVELAKVPGSRTEFEEECH